ncbi:MULTISPECIES: metallophosphoesterase [unclassified Corynebacterium]|uniref:metallophosphoesterase n=1 Tax=unclassified Corynebacterium TaxID=2624378 RepID=UPI0027956998|nr:MULTISPECIES: metallophosphoesterase [unclassified Corynebacterium]
MGFILLKGRYTELVSTFPKTLAITSAAATALGAGILAWAWRETAQFELKELTVPLLAKGTLRGNKEFRILHVSDLHMVAGQTRKQDWVRGLAQLNPDLVVNTGDNLSDPKGVPGVIRALEPLLRKPGLFVFGTNDYFAPKMVNPFVYLMGKKRTPSTVELPWKGMRAVFVEHGWRDANQARHEFQVGPVRIAAAGVDDPHHNLDDYSEVAGAPNPDADLSLALVHSPEPRVLSAFAEDGYQLSLSGHTHGGQLCLPGGRAIVTNCGIDRERANGLHRFGPMWMHVSNGLGSSRFVPFRLFNRPSATLLRIVEVE